MFLSPSPSSLLFLWALLLVLFLGGLPKAWAAQHAVILHYEHVSERTPPKQSISPDNFAQHLKIIEKEGFQVWPLPTILSYLRTRKPLPDKVVAITFDRAYISVFQNAIPLLQARQWPFTLFISTQDVESIYPTFMTWKMLKEVQAKGVTFANQAYRYDFLVRLQAQETPQAWYQRILTSIKENQARIEMHLGKQPKIFAYPYGEFSPELQSLIAKAGYYGVGQQEGPASLYASLTALPRFSMTGAHAQVASLSSKLYALPLPVVKQVPQSPVLDGQERRPSVYLEIENGDYRLQSLNCYDHQGHLLKVKREKNHLQASQIWVSTTYDLSAGQGYFQCKAPSKESARTYWWMMPWFIPDENGRWYRKP